MPRQAKDKIMRKTLLLTAALVFCGIVTVRAAGDEKNGHTALWGVVAAGSHAQTSLPRIMIKAAEEVSHGKKVKATFTLEQTDEATGRITTETHSCRVSYGGESSSSYDKKSWNVNFIDENGKEQYVNLLGMRGNCSKWILDAAAGDRSRMHNRMAMDVLASYSRLPYETDNARRYASKGRYIELWANGEYKGLFCLTDRINRELLGGTATTDGQTRCVIYTVKNYGSGNYLNPYKEGPADGDENWNSWEMKYPDEPTAAAWQPLLNLFNASWDDMPNDEYVTTVRRYFYWDNLVDVYLLTMVCGLADVGYKNIYLACPDITKDGRCVLAPVDMDYTFGCTWNGCYWDEKPQLRGGNTLHFVRPFYRLLRDKDLGFIAALAKRWAALRDNVLSVASVTALINGYAQLLDESGAWQREHALWNYNPVTTEATASEAARYMTEWYANSHKAISQLLDPYLPMAHQAVDLGLSVAWADRNLGAERPEAVGYMLAWGELEPKSEYTLGSYRLGIGKYWHPTKYVGNSQASDTTPDGKSRLEAEDDAATQMLGGKWRMPTREELTELVEKCQWQWVANGDSIGYRVTGPSGRSIFLPATGFCTGKRHLLTRAEGFYWSSDAITYLLDVAFALRFTPRIINQSNYKETPRSNGCAIRAVQHTE
jgi:hypothetical protein